MQLILAIDADRRQADELSALVTNRLPGVELIQATSAGEALQALGDRVPDLLLTSALLSPFDDGVLAEYLRELGSSAAHVQALRIPVLSSPKPTGGSVFSFGRKKRQTAAPDGCDPGFFADEILVYLARAAEEKQSATESQLHAERREAHAFTTAEPDVTPTYVPAYAPEPYVTPYDQVDRASFELPAAEPEDAAPIYVAPSASDAGHDAESTEQDPGYAFRSPKQETAYGFRATPQDLAYGFASPQQVPAHRVEAYRREDPPVRAAAHAEDDRQPEPFSRWEVVASEPEPLIAPSHVEATNDPLLEVAAPHHSEPTFARPLGAASAGETVIGVAPLTTSDDHGDPDLFVLDTATVSDQAVFELERVEPVEVEEESPVPVYSLDEPYQIELAETLIETPAVAALDSPTNASPSPEFGVDDLATPAAAAEDDLSDLNLNAIAASTESDAPAATAVVELLVADAPEPEPPSPPPYRVEPSHVRVKSRSTVAFEAALAAIRRAWGKSRKAEPRQPEPAPQLEPVAEPIVSAVSEPATDTFEPTPEQLAPQFFDPAPAPRFEPSLQTQSFEAAPAPQSFEAAPAPQSFEAAPAPQLFEAPPAPQLFEAPPAPQLFEAAPAAAIQLDGDDSIARVPELADTHKSEAPVELSFHADPLAAVTPTEFVMPAEDVTTALHDELGSPIAAEETTLPAPALHTELATAPASPVALPPSDKKPETAASSDLVERLIRAVLTKEPITSILADRPATQPTVVPEALTPEAAKPVLASPLPAIAAVEPIAEPDSLTLDTAEPVLAGPPPAVASLEPIAAPAPLYESATQDWAQPTTTSHKDLTIDDGIPDAETRAALEVDLTRDLNALEEESFVEGLAETEAAQAAAAARAATVHPPVAMPEPVPTAAVPDEDVYELDVSPGSDDLESEIAAAAPPRPVREALPRIESSEPVPVQAQAQTEARKADRLRKKADKRKAAAAKPRTPSNRPVQDEWGLFDPNRCGFAALVDKLNEVSEEEDPKAKQTTVRVISYR